MPVRGWFDPKASSHRDINLTHRHFKQLAIQIIHREQVASGSRICRNSVGQDRLTFSIMASSLHLRHSLIKQILVLIGFVGVSYSAGLIGSLTTETGDGSWYAQLEKPVFNPPGWAFGVVWPLLYTLMGIAAWLVWREGWSRHVVKVALGWFAAQLVLNAIWTPVFFGGEAPFAGLVVISFLFAAILITTHRFWRVSRVAGLLLVPYILWVAFAIALNAAIWMLN